MTSLWNSLGEFINYCITFRYWWYRLVKMSATSIIDGESEIEAKIQERRKFIAISHIKVPKQKDESFVASTLRTHLQKIFSNCSNITIKYELGKLMEDFDDEGNRCTIIECNVTKEQQVIQNKMDLNHGKISFYCLSTEADKIYAVIQSGYTSAWASIKQFRDFDFSKKFAKAFLNPAKIKQTTGCYLTGINSGTVKTSYASWDRFDSSDIISRYGIVTDLHASVLDNKRGSMLLELCKFAEKSSYVKMQTGQVSLSLVATFQPKEFIRLLKFIDSNIYRCTTENELSELERNWNFITYIKPTYKSETKLRSQLLSDMYRIYENSKETVSSFDVHSGLMYPQQDSLDSCQDVKLYIGDHPVKWGTGLSTKLGGGITLRDVLDALEENSNGMLTSASSMAKVKIEFFTYVESKRVRQCVHKLIGASIMKDGAYFQHRKSWYKVDCDTFLDTNKRFVNVIQDKKYRPEYMESTPDLLHWYTKENVVKGKEMSFTLDELLSFVTCNDVNEQREEITELLIKTLTSSTTYLHQLEDMTWINNFICHRSDISKEHDTQLLDLNVMVLEESSFANQNDIKPFKTHKSETNSVERRSYNKIGNIFKDCQQQDDIEREMRSVFVNKGMLEIKKFVESLKQARKIIRHIGDDQFIVENPYLTVSVWKDLTEGYLKLKVSECFRCPVCPARLIQFLRMYIRKDEGDYNELYHLSNCRCRKENPWIYIVGDRILAKDSLYVELFDVMICSKDYKKAYMLHVKKGFSADSFRAVCSQVRVCGDLVWKALSMHSPTNIFQKFYRVATSINDTTNTHRQLTRNEINGVSATEDGFLKIMKSNDLKFIICLAPCLPQENNLSNVLHANLDYVYTNDDFSLLTKNPFEKLVDTGILHKETHCITGKFFVTKIEFKKLVNTDPKSLAESAHDILRKKAYGNHEKSLLMNGSFVAKVALIDLNRTFSDYVVHGNERVSLNIMEIPKLEAVEKYPQSKQKPDKLKKGVMKPHSRAATGSRKRVRILESEEEVKTPTITDYFKSETKKFKEEPL